MFLHLVTGVEVQGFRAAASRVLICCGDLGNGRFWTWDVLQRQKSFLLDPPSAPDITRDSRVDGFRVGGSFQGWICKSYMCLQFIVTGSSESNPQTLSIVDRLRWGYRPRKTL